MQTQTKLPSKLGPKIVLALLLVLGSLAGLQRLRHPIPTQEPAPAMSVEYPRSQILIEREIMAFAERVSEDQKKSFTISLDEDGNSRSRSLDRDGVLPRWSNGGTEIAEAHNLLRMRSYQDRVTRQLKSGTPILPVRFVPTLEETIFEESNTK